MRSFVASSGGLQTTPYVVIFRVHTRVFQRFSSSTGLVNIAGLVKLHTVL